MAVYTEISSSFSTQEVEHKYNPVNQQYEKVTLGECQKEGKLEEKGAYVFILDRSGSMDSDQRITLGKEALVKFLNFIPEGSKF